MSKYYLLGTTPYDGVRTTVLQDNHGNVQYFYSFLDACKSANELHEMKVMGGIRVIKVKPRTATT